jgi:hypothetical protein
VNSLFIEALERDYLGHCVVLHLFIVERVTKKEDNLEESRERTCVESICLLYWFYKELNKIEYRNRR